MKFFGLDWAAIVLSLVALSLLGGRNRLGFVSFLAANLCWIVIGRMAGSPAISVGNVIFFGANLRGYLAWRRDTAVPIPAEAHATET